ncbi:MAG: hypothetical protein WCP85_29550 [Mariniphaga sp.]
MIAFKDIIPRQYSDLDSFRSLVSNEDFREYVGVSFDKYEAILGRVDSIIDQSAHKIQGPTLTNALSMYKCTSHFYDHSPALLNSSASTNSLWADTVNHNGIAISAIVESSDIFEANNKNSLRFLTGAEASSRDTVPFYPWESFSSFLNLEGNAISRFQPFIETKPQHDSHFIRSLKEKYGTDWLFMYKKLIRLILVLKILFLIEKLKFHYQQIIFFNSIFRFSEFEYFDLVFTLKRLGNNSLVVIVNHPIFSLKTKIEYENQEYN